jgi:preprotein translocase SecE subunit
VARAVRGQPVRPRPPVGPPAGAGDRNYFASVVDELRKVVWPTWNELGRMTGVVVTTVILMAVIVSAADYGLGYVVKQLYTSSSPAAGSQVTAQPSVVKPSAKATPTSTGGSTAPVSP